MTGTEYLDTLLDTSLFLPHLRVCSAWFAPGLPLCEAARRAAACTGAHELRLWLEGMADGFAHAYAADGGQFARALQAAAQRCGSSAAAAAAQSAIQNARFGLPDMLRKSYRAAQTVQAQSDVTRTLGCFARRWVS